MERVARNRDMPQEQCMVSSPIHPLGTWLWVYGKNTGNLELCFVTDISHPRDRERHIRTRRVIELGYNEALRMCGRKHMKDPPTSCPVMTVKL
jgi:hypothetical protein